VLELIRARVEGKVYGTLPAKQPAVEAELEKLAADPERVKRLSGWQWIRRALATLDQPNVALG
jgi:hypothetical protein